MGEHGWEYRRRRPEGTVLYEAMRDNLATLVEEASEVGRGLPRYVEPDWGTRHSGAPGIALAACEAGPGAGATPAGVVLRCST